MEEQNLEFRATKDIDLVLLTNGSAALNARISGYVKEGKYKVKEATKEGPRYYRFREPASEEFPDSIEIFARNEQNIDLADGQYVIPIQNDEVARISAILLDEEYFAIIKANCVRASGGASLINALANICLKARAHRELSERRARGEKVDEKDVKKHRNDILRLAVTLTGGERLALGPQAKVDLVMALKLLQEMPEPQFKQVMEKYPGVKQAEALTLVRNVFSL